MEKAYIEVLLSAWGRWAISIQTRSIGFPSQSPMFKDTPPGKSFGSAPPLGVGCDTGDMESINEAIKRMPVFHRVVLIEFYQIGGTTREIAARLGCAQTTFNSYLTAAKEIFKDYLTQG